MKSFPIVLAFIALATSTVSMARPRQSKERQFFESKVRPLLADNCFECHGAKKQKGGLRLDSRPAILKGGDSGPAIVPGEPAESLLIDAVTYLNSDLEMPPKRKLGKRQVETLTTWIAMGAPWPGGPKGELARDEKTFEITDKDRAYWAFQPLASPRKKNLDAVVATALAERKLQANPVAPREVLIRRAYFDLIGLPPSFEDVEAFVADQDPGAFANLIDRLLAMPEYGERWGRHWLDVVRFAQSNGYERDDEKPHAWRYRDYVISSFNEDKPYDRFVLEQIAGDELPDGGDVGWVATGFYRLGVWDDEPDDKRAAEFDGQDDILKTTTETFLGLTVGCARCHDHMFDPISQRDYYEMLAFFRNVKPYARPGADILRKITGGEALVVTERGTSAIDTHVLIRGNAGRPADKVDPHFPEVLGGGAPDVSATGHSTGRRLAFARWVASEKNPLTARVMANRLWHFHTGRGIVATPNDFGRAGHPPSNVELLDWLAAELIESGWSLKHMHRVIMASQTWQRSSAQNVANDSIDPGNEFYWRANLRRLEAEVIRDSILKSSGVLNPERGGRGFFPVLAGEVVAGASKPGRNWQWSSPEQQQRRSVYAFVKRTMLYPFFEIFDYTNTEGSLGVRPTTTVAPQALLLLNSELVADSAQRVAEKAAQHPDPVSESFRMILSRNPTEQELKLAATYLADQESKQRERTDVLSFRPDYPPALFNGYQGGLPAERFLRGPGKGWSYFKGRWSGGYEGILNAEREWPAYALFRPSAEDLTVSGRLRFGKITERVSLLLRARPQGDAFDGYSVLLDPMVGEAVLRRHQGGKIQDLARGPIDLPKQQFVAFKASVKGGLLSVSFDGKTVKVTDPNPLSGGGQIGVNVWAGPVTFDDLEVIAGEVRYPVAALDVERTEFSPVEVSTKMLNGLSAYGGNWTVRGGTVAVAPDKGGKIVWEELGALKDGDSFSAELRITEGEIAGLLLNVREPKVGADNWIGYEISLYLNESSVVVGTHENNWKRLVTAKAPVKRGDWHRLRALTENGHVKVYLDDGAEPVVDLKMERPLAPGMVGLRTWGARVEYRNLAVQRKGGEELAWKPQEKETDTPKTLSKVVLADRTGVARRRALEEFCSLLFNLNEFVYID